MNDNRRANAVDAFLGQRVREKRMELGIAQAALAEAIGVSHQQVQKYEIGDTRISVRTLLDLAKALKVNPAYFYEGVERVHG